MILLLAIFALLGCAALLWWDYVAEEARGRRIDRSWDEMPLTLKRRLRR